MDHDNPQNPFRQWDIQLPKVPKLPKNPFLYLIAGVILLLVLVGPSTRSSPTKWASSSGSENSSGQATRGFNFKLPFGLEALTKVPVQRQLKLEFGFRTVRAGR